MSTIRRFMFVGAAVCCAVWLLWLLLGGIFSAASSMVPHAWVIILVAMVVGVVAWVLRYPANEINALGENKIVWGLFQTVLVVGFIALYILATLWIYNNFLLWAGIDASPRVQVFMSVAVVGLCLFPLPPLINWIIPTSGIFSKAVWRTLFATSLLLLVVMVFLPKTFFEPTTGKPLATIDSEGNTFFDPAKKFSPATQEPLKPITSEQAKKIKPWWESVLSVIEKWSENSPNSNAGVVTPAPWNPAAGRREASDEVVNPSDPEVIRLKMDREWFTHLKVVVRPADGEIMVTPFMLLPKCLPKAQFWYDVIPRNKETVLRVKDEKRGQLWEITTGDYKSGPLPIILRGDLLVQIETKKEVVLILNCFT